MPSPRVLLPAGLIEARVHELAAAIDRDVPTPLHVIGVLTGAFVFVADLVRALRGPLTVDFIAASSYAGTSTSGQVRLLQDTTLPLDGRDVLLVEDIVDTGLTLQALQDHLRARAPRSLRTVALLDKPSRRRAGVRLDYVGFTIPDVFVVGYGLDYEGRYRNLPGVAELADE
ncbi:MAG TPA: hypoxanthine phosphoribosyltransferase [Vicinamibacterales bacterium]|nr:hypoxanthine phosphoribosyltransferase [Vicinamibacterales bacterium]